MFGLAEALKSEGKTADSDAVLQEFREAWRHADTKLVISDL
jgi:hypothetical protein